MLRLARLPATSVGRLYAPEQTVLGRVPTRRADCSALHCLLPLDSAISLTGACRLLPHHNPHRRRHAVLAPIPGLCAEDVFQFSYHQ